MKNMILKSKFEKIVIYGFFIYIAIGTFLVFGSIEVNTGIQILIRLGIVGLTLFGVFKLSKYISVHSTVRLLFHTDRKAIVGIRERGEFKKWKSILKYNTLLFLKYMILFAVLIIIFEPVTYYLRIFFHELNHGVAAVLFGGDLQEIKLTGPGSGYTRYWFRTDALFHDQLITLISLAGSVGTLTALISILLVLVKHHSSMKIELYTPLYIILGYNIYVELRYWHLSFLYDLGDAKNVMDYSPFITQQAGLIASLILLIGGSITLTAVLVINFYKRGRRILNRIIPDLTVFAYSDEVQN
jgi:hypothetical protein